MAGTRGLEGCRAPGTICGFGQLLKLVKDLSQGLTWNLLFQQSTLLGEGRRGRRPESGRDAFHSGPFVPANSGG